MRRAAILLLLVTAFAFSAGAADERALLPFVWNDVTGTRDMPWMGSGGRARWYKRDVTKPWDVMNPRGPTIETVWGSSGGSGESPFETGDRAAGYLERVGFLKEWPTYPPVDGKPGRRAFPYRMTIVCIEPTVAILRFDLSAVLEDPIEFSAGSFPPSQSETYYEQRVSGGSIVNSAMFGTHVAAGGSLLWFSPDAPVAPTPLVLSGGRAKIALKGFSLDLELRGGEIVVRR
jgi:hypothetical protein